MTLLTQIMQNGLIQPGHFYTGEGASSPVRIRLDMLPSYPAVLRTITDMILETIQGSPLPERLVCSNVALPSAIAVSMKTDIPLVYSQGTEANPVRDLVGAYDVGHPAVLILNTLHDFQFLEQFTMQASRVGLDIEQIIVLLCSENTPETVSIPILPVMTWEVLLPALEADSWLTASQRKAILEWTQSQ